MSPEADVSRLSRRLERERRARHEAEAIAEHSTRKLYEAFQNLRQSQTELHATSELVQLLQRAAVASNEANALDEAAAKVLADVCHYMGWPVGHLYVAGDGEMLPTGVWHFDDPERFHTLREVTERTPLPSGAGLPGRVLATGRPAWIVDVTQDDNFPRAKAVLDIGVKAAFGFPVLSGNEVAAVLEFFSNEPIERDEALIEAMANIGTQLGRVVERTTYERRLSHQALHDPLTALPNRSLLLDRLRHALALSRRSESLTAVLFVDLDRFKTVNDNFGHDSGDQLLLEVAQRLPGALRAGDTFGRLGGDEFVIICEGLSAVEDAMTVAERVIQTLSGAFVLSTGEVFISASVGMAAVRSGDADAEQLLGDADLAMYRAKERGRGSYVVYDPGMRTRLADRINTENDLRRGMRREELEVFYQPIVDVTAGAVTAVEALVRWRHPERGLLAPSEFVGIAEDTGLILPLGDFVLVEACRQLAEWQRAGMAPPELKMSVNVSIRQLEHVGFVDHVRAALTKAQLEPQSLVLEVTESVLMDDVMIVRQLAELRELGVRLAIDDFGTGYSSLDRVRRMPVGTLKIDMTFVSELEQSVEGEPLVGAMIAMARQLGLGVVAEGVETQGQLHTLRRLGCESAQGFLFSPPVAAGEFGELLRDGFWSTTRP